MKISEMDRPAREHGSRVRCEGLCARTLRGAASAALIGLAFLAASTSALAGIPGITATVTSLVPGAPGAKRDLVQQ